jgi:hypothetical protein
MKFELRETTELEKDIVGILQGYNGVLVGTLLLIGGFR